MKMTPRTMRSKKKPLGERVLRVPTSSPRSNCELFIQAAMKVAPVGVAWGPNGERWDVAREVKPTQRSHGSQTTEVIFRIHVPGEHKRKKGRIFPREMIEIVQADIAHRLHRKVQTVMNLRKQVDGWRALYLVMKSISYDVSKLTVGHFDEAAQILAKHYSHQTSKQRHQVLSRIARLLNVNRMTAAQFQWSRKRYQSSIQHIAEVESRQEVSSRVDKFANMEILQAIGKLYQIIPRNCPSDRYRICMLTVLALCGLRVGEAILLPAEHITVDSDGVYWLEYYRFKRESGSARDSANPNARLRRRPTRTRKPIPTHWGPIVADAIEELLLLTSEARQTAAWCESHEWCARVPECLPDQMTMQDIEHHLNVSNANDFCLRRLIPRCPDVLGRLWVDKSDLCDALKREVWTRPALYVSDTNEVVPLSKILGVSLINWFRKDGKPYPYAIAPVKWHHIAHALTGRADGVKTIFQRYNVRSSSGKEFAISTHGLRRFVNDALDRGGLSDTAQADWFGRSDIAQNSAYHSTTPFERARQLRAIILNGKFHGKPVDDIRSMPASRRDSYADIRIHAVLKTKVGMCCHEFSQAPCPYHFDCDVQCDDLIMGDYSDGSVEALEQSVQELTAQKAVAMEKVYQGETGASNWLQHFSRVLKAHESALALARQQKHP